MEALSHLQNNKDNPIRYLFYTGLFYILCLIFPQNIGLDIIIAILCALVFIVRPLWGIFFIIAVHPIMSCSFELFWTAGMPVEIIPSNSVPYGETLISPGLYPASLYPFQIASFILLPALIFHCRPFSDQNTSSRYQKIIYTSLSFFFIWGVLTSLQATYPYKALFGLSRFLSITIIICYLVRFIDRVEILKKVMIVYCCAALLMSFFAYYGTYNGFENISYIWNNYGFSISQRQSLINGSTSFTPETQGMLPGFGISAKHEFSTFVVVGFFFSSYLFITVKNKVLSLFYLVASLTTFLSLFYGPSKLSLAGIIIGVLLVTILSSTVRRHIAVVFIILIALNIFGLIASDYTRPLHAKLMAGSTKNIKVVNDDSEFSLSLKGRIAIMKKAAKHIKESNGIGIGSDMLNHDHIFTHVHGHNLLITLFAEYGFPAIICVFILGTLLASRVAPIISAQTCAQNTISLAVLPMTASFFAILFEYSFDCFAWAPQLWITGSLLWIIANIAKNDQIVSNLKVNS